MRSGDTISRWGGDEFGILLEELATDAEANAAAERLIDTLRDPFWIASTEVFVSASIGIVVSEVGAEACDDLLRYADLAMYRAKVERTGSYCRYEPEMQADVKARVELDRDLRQAIEREELSVAYQPIVDLTTRRIVGVEALARWTHPVRGRDPADRVHPGRRGERDDHRDRQVRATGGVPQRAGVACRPARISR